MRINLKSLFDKVEYRGPKALVLFVITCAVASASAEGYISLKKHTAMQVVSAQGSASMKAGPDELYHGIGTINGHKVKFLLDTGASDVVVPEAMVEKLGVERGHSVRYYTSSGLEVGSDLTIQHMKIGGITLSDVRGGSAPMLMTDDTVLLGMSFLGKLDMRQKDGVMILEGRE